MTTLTTAHRARPAHTRGVVPGARTVHSRSTSARPGVTRSHSEAASRQTPTPLPRVHVELRCDDPLVRAGLEEVLAGHPRVRLTGTDVAGSTAETEAGAGRVVVLVADRFRADLLGAPLTAEAAGTTQTPTVLITPELDAHELLAAVDAGVSAVLNPDAATDRARLAAAIVAVSEGRAQLPTDLQGVLAAQVRRLREEVLTPNGLTLSGLTARECDVLRLIAEGYDTAEIGRQLAFSERTVKYVLAAVMARFDLRSRAHAVAFAVRLGAI